MATSNADLNWIANYIWGIADDVLRDLYVRGKYRDVILPMTVLRRLDAVLENDQAERAGHEGSARRGRASSTQDAALRQAAGQAFYNTSTFTLRDLRARASQQLTADFEAYVDGFSPERAGHPGQLRVPQPDPAAVKGGRAGHADRETHLARRQT